MHHRLDCPACRSLKTTRIIACASLAPSLVLLVLGMANTAPQVPALAEKPVAVAVARHSAAHVEIGNNPYNGDPGIFLYDKDSRLVGELSVDEDGGMPTLMFRRPDGGMTLWLTQSRGKDPIPGMSLGIPGPSHAGVTIGVREDKELKQPVGYMTLKAADDTTVFEK